MKMLLILEDETTGIKEAIVPLAVFLGFLLAIWAVLSWISERNSRSTERLMRHSRPASLAEIEDPKAVKKSERFQWITDMDKSISQPLMPQTEVQQSVLTV